MSTSEPNDIAQQAARRLRQKERTVDNLNRLFAMLFSIVFSIGAAAIAEKVFRTLASPAPHEVSHISILFNFGAITILGSTVAIFFTKLPAVSTSHTLLVQTLSQVHWASSSTTLSS